MKNQVSQNQLKCLEILAHHYEHESDCIFMTWIAKKTGFKYAKVRVYVRALARKGYAEYQRGLFNMNDGGVAGSGYRCTAKGYEVASILLGKPALNEEEYY